MDRSAAPLPLSPALRTQQATELRKRIAAQLPPATIQLNITNNRSVMISVTRDPKHRKFRVRLHHVFVDAPDDVVRHLARYIAQNDTESSRHLHAYIDQNAGPQRGPTSDKRPRVSKRTSGRHHDIGGYFEQLNRDYFGGRVDCALSWGRHVARGRARRSINVGSYTFEDHIIRLHPGLDRAWIPDFYVQWVLFHEMLHAVQPLHKVNGRHQFHTPEFRAGEQQFDRHDEAHTWERKNLAFLLKI